MALDSVSIKLPTFWTTSPEAWFVLAEAQFAIRNITNQETQYYHVVASLDTATANRALSILTSPPLQEKYTTLKNFLLSSFSLSEEERAMALLNMNNLGDKKPSELMDEMLALLGDHKPCFLFKHIFLAQLPNTVRVPLAMSPTKDYRALAQEADRLLLATRDQGSTVMTAHQVAANVSSSKRIRKNCNKQSQSIRNSTSCYFHRKFGSLARQCVQPCTFSQANVSSDQDQGNDQAGQQ